MALFDDIRPIYRDKIDNNYQLTLGRYPEILVYHKFGGNPAVEATEEDIWTQGGKETLLTSAATMYASCTDNTNGVGQTYRVEGLDANWDTQYGQVVLNGNAQVAVTTLTGGAATWTRIHRVYQTSATPNPVGDVYIAETDTLTGGVPNTASKIHANIDTSTAAQTQKAMFTVPRDYVGIVNQVHVELQAATGSARSAVVFCKQQVPTSASTDASPEWSPWRSAAQLQVSTNGPIADKLFTYGLVLPELTNFHLAATATSSSYILASFDIILIPTGSDPMYTVHN